MKKCERCGKSYATVLQTLKMSGKEQLHCAGCNDKYVGWCAQEGLGWGPSRIANCAKCDKPGSVIITAKGHDFPACYGCAVRSYWSGKSVLKTSLEENKLIFKNRIEDSRHDKNCGDCRKFTTSLAAILKKLYEEKKSDWRIGETVFSHGHHMGYTSDWAGNLMKFYYGIAAEVEGSTAHRTSTSIEVLYKGKCIAAYSGNLTRANLETFTEAGKLFDYDKKHAFNIYIENHLEEGGSEPYGAWSLSSLNTVEAVLRIIFMAAMEANIPGQWHIYKEEKNA